MATTTSNSPAMRTRCSVVSNGRKRPRPQALGEQGLVLRVRAAGQRDLAHAALAGVDEAQRGLEIGQRRGLGPQLQAAAAGQAQPRALLVAAAVDQAPALPMPRFGIIP